MLLGCYVKLAGGGKEWMTRGQGFRAQAWEWHVSLLQGLTPMLGLVKSLDVRELKQQGLLGA